MRENLPQRKLNRLWLFTKKDSILLQYVQNIEKKILGNIVGANFVRPYICMKKDIIRYWNTIIKYKEKNCYQLHSHGLGLELNISKIAISIIGIDITYYAILIVGAIILALVILKLKDGLYNIKFQNILDLSLWLIPIAFICARFYYVIFNLDYFSTNPLQILNIRNGGLAIYGGIIGGVITTYIFCKKRNITFLNMLDYITPTLALGQAIGRWGNFFNIEAYGTEVNNIFRMGILENGIYKEVHPTFLYESTVTFLLALFLLRLQKNRKFKRRNYIYIFNYLFFGKIFYRNVKNWQFNARKLQNFSNFIYNYFCNILLYFLKKQNKIIKKSIKHTKMNKKCKTFFPENGTK